MELQYQMSILSVCFMMLQFAEYNLLVRVRVCQVQNGQTRRKKVWQPQAFQAGFLTFKLNLIFNSVIILLESSAASASSNGKWYVSGKMKE